MKTGDPERGEIVDDNLRAAGETKKDVGSGIVAQTDGQSKKLAQGHVDASLRIFVLKWTERLGENQVGIFEGYELIEREFSFFDLVEHGERQGEFENRLHRRVSGVVQVAVERGAGERAGDGNFSVGIGGDGTNLLLKSLLTDGKLRKH